MIEEESDQPRENQVDFMYFVDFGNEDTTTGLPMMNGHVLNKMTGQFDVASVLVKQTEQTQVTGPALKSLEKNDVSSTKVPTIHCIDPFEFMPLSKYRRVLFVGGEQISRKEDVKRVTDSAKTDGVKVMIELGPICDSTFVKEKKKKKRANDESAQDAAPNGTAGFDEVQVVAAPIKKNDVIPIDEDPPAAVKPDAVKPVALPPAAAEPKNLLVDSSSSSKQTKKSAESKNPACRLDMKRSTAASQAKFAAKANKGSQPSSTSSSDATSAVPPGKDDSDDGDEGEQIDDEEKRRRQDERNKVEVRGKRREAIVMLRAVDYYIFITLTKHSMCRFPPPSLCSSPSQDDLDAELDSTFRSHIQSSAFNYNSLAGVETKKIKTDIRKFFENNKATFVKFARGDNTTKIFVRIFRNGTKDQNKRREKLFNDWVTAMYTNKFKVQARTFETGPTIPKKNKKASSQTVSTSAYAAPAPGASKYSSSRPNPNNSSISNPNNNSNNNNSDNSGGAFRQRRPPVATTIAPAPISSRWREFDDFELEFDSSAAGLGISVNWGTYEDNGMEVEGMNLLKYNLDKVNGTRAAADQIEAKGGCGIDVRTYKHNSQKMLNLSNAWLTHFKLKRLGSGLTWTAVEMLGATISDKLEKLKDLTNTIKQEQLLLPDSGLVLKFRLGKIPTKIDGYTVGRTSPANGYPTPMQQQQQQGALKRSNDRQAGGGGRGKAKLAKIPIADERKFREFANNLNEMFKDERYYWNGINIRVLSTEYTRFCEERR